MSLSKEHQSGWAALQRARAYIKLKHPYFYSTLLGLIPRHANDIGTMFVTRSMVLGIDMDWFPTLSVEIASGCLLHEVMHILRDITRIDAFEDQLIAGYAFDIPINDDLKAFGIELPEWVVYSSTYNLPGGFTGEKYYELLQKKWKNKTPAPGRIGAGNCGSCAGDFQDVIDLGDDGRIPADVQHFRRTGIQEIREHMNKGGFGRGNIPNSLRELLLFTGEEQSIIPWEQMLGTKMAGAFGRLCHGHVDYSLRKPSKRSYSLGMVRPGLINYEPSVIYIEDSSGSMGSHQLRENRVEAAGIMAQLGLTEIWFFNADVIAQTEPRKVSINELRTLPVVGRGGTDFRPAIERVLKMRPIPDLALYSTDGDGEAPPFKPRNIGEFIWLLAPGEWTRSPCNWGIQILTSNDRTARKKFKILD